MNLHITSAQFRAMCFIGILIEICFLCVLGGGFNLYVVTKTVLNH